MSSRKTIQLVPSLLAADFASLGQAVKTVMAAGASWVSVDVMDGHFVPNLSFGPEHVRAVKNMADVMIDAHLMVSNPEAAFPWFVESGADIVTVHYEACADAHALLKRIREAGAKCGLAIKPSTPVEPLLRLLPELDLALIMTVEPGFGGAKFMEDMMPKVRAVRQAIDEQGLDCWLQVDGGINTKTIEIAAQAGADSLVAGSAVFAAADPGRACAALLKQAQDAFHKNDF